MKRSPSKNITLRWAELGKAHVPNHTLGEVMTTTTRKQARKQHTPLLLDVNQRILGNACWEGSPTLSDGSGL